MSANLADLTAGTAIADDDILHLRTTGGLDQKITGANLRSSLQLKRQELTTGATIDLNLITADLFVQMDSGSAQAVTFQNAPDSGFSITVYNKGAGTLTVTDTGATFSRTVIQGGWLKLFASSTGLVLEDLVVYPIGTTHIQFPGESTPATLGLPGTWTAQFESEGITFRTPGGNATAFNSGIQEDAFQGHWHNLRSDVSSASGGGTHGSGAYYSESNDRVRQAVTDGVNGTPRTANETRGRNRTFRVWRRTA
jgi:hypothetical protein